MLEARIKFNNCNPNGRSTAVERALENESFEQVIESMLMKAKRILANFSSIYILDCMTTASNLATAD